MNLLINYNNVCRAAPGFVRQALQPVLSDKMPSVKPIEVREYGKGCQNIYNLNIFWQFFVQLSDGRAAYLQLFYGLTLYIQLSNEWTVFVHG